MSIIAGIDLGTTHSLIGVMDAGFPILIADEHGNRLTPSVVHFPGSGEPMVGREAARMRVLDPRHTVSSIKRFIGARGADIVRDEVPYRIEGPPSAAARVQIRERGYSPEEISALILQKLKRDAERALGVPVVRAVITVPAYFNDAQRQATKAAGELAGFEVERIINEPTAAALAYGLGRRQERSRIAVYDFGGGTFDLSILELNGEVFQVIATNGNTHLGGDDIDARIVEALMAKMGPPFSGLTPSPEMLARLRESAIDAKHRLSTSAAVQIDLPFFSGDLSFAGTLDRRELEDISRPVVERTRSHCVRALADAKIQAADLDEIILVGGMTRMPLVREIVRDIFGREPNVSQNPDEAVALGATIQAGVLSGAVDHVLLLDVTPLSLGIETFGGLMNVIIPRNSTIPIKGGEMFTNAISNQTAMQIKVLQGEREMARDNWTLGEFTLPFEAAPKGRARVGVQFEIDANGILHVLARDIATGREKVVEVSSAVDVSDEAVEQMIADSLEHAFEDMSDRIFTEAKLKSDEMLPAVRSALEVLGTEIDPQEQDKIRLLMREVEEAGRAGEVARLKRANTALDEGTQHLAALLMERALRAAGEPPG